MRLHPGLRASEGRRRCRHGPAVAPASRQKEKPERPPPLLREPGGLLAAAWPQDLSVRM